MAVEGSGRNQPGLIAGFDSQQQLRRFSKQPAKVHSRDAQLAKLGGGDRRDFVFLDGEITGVDGNHEQRSLLGLQLLAKRLDGVTGPPRRKPLAQYSAICTTAVVPQTDGVI
jgi:hypothetical protein